MITAIYHFIIKFFFWLLGVIGSIIIYPIQVILVTLFPTLGDFVSITLTFFKGYIFPLITFIKQVIMNITCMPEELWSLFVGFIIARWMIAPAYRGIKFVYNLWRVWRGTV